MNDPLIGWLSDHTRTRWGRRLPWIVMSVLPFALFFWMQWLVPGFISQENQLGLFAYYALVSIAYNSFYTGLILPHNALTAELTSSYDERSRITGFRMAFSLAGSVGGLLLALVVFKLLKNAAPTLQYMIFGATISAIGIGAMAFCLAGIWRTVRQRERDRAPEFEAAQKLPLSRQLAIIFANRPFLIVCGIYLFSWMAMQFTATILPFYVESCMRLPASDFQLLALTVQATALLLIPAWGWLSVRAGKKPVYFYGMSLWLLAQVGLLFLGPGAKGLLFGLAVLAGFGISVCYLIPNAMLPTRSNTTSSAPASAARASSTASSCFSKRSRSRSAHSSSCKCSPRPATSRTAPGRPPPCSPRAPSPRSASPSRHCPPSRSSSACSARGVSRSIKRSTPKSCAARGTARCRVVHRRQALQRGKKPL